MLKGLTLAAAVSAAAVSAVVMAGCGSSSSSAISTTVATTSAATSTTGVTSTSSSATTSEPATSVTSPPTTGTPACTAPDFTAALHGTPNGAAGTIYYTIQATNVSGAACRTGGYFGVSSYNVAGHAISTQDERIQPGAVRQFTLAAGGALTFMVGLSDVSTATQSTCPQVGALHLIPPNDTRYVQLSFLDSAGQGATIVGCTANLPVTPAVAS